MSVRTRSGMLAHSGHGACESACVAGTSPPALHIQYVRQLCEPARERVQEYLGITGLPEFCKLAQKLAFGDSPASSEGRIVTAQALSGTGSLRVGAEYLSKFYSSKLIYVCQPTWGNHNSIFPKGGLTIKPYRYYCPKTQVQAVDHSFLSVLM
jgi:aspartate/tyrosine/aromatic aminotransferase